MKRYFAILAFALCCVGILKGQTTADSLTIVSANGRWHILEREECAKACLMPNAL